MNILEIVPATGLFTWAWLLIVIPLATAGVLLLAGRAADSWGHLLGTASAVADFVLGVMLFAALLGLPADGRRIGVATYEWIRVGDWSVTAGLLVDQLSILFVLLVAGVGSLIFIYSIGYMAADPNRRLFFAYLNLFIASMLLLVLANNYLLLFVGWEGVGLASYLLIGFWQDKRSAALAAKKAFLVNRVGDLGLTVAIFIALAYFGSVDYEVVNANVANLSPTWANLMGFALLLAACGKSAQVPLQSWLLDAMEGPTPVSALIHAATMVTAGVYLVVRSQALYELAPAAQLAVAVVGTVTILAGAWIGCAKDDIKKVLAGSTMSQIGYMMLAAGLGPAGGAFAIFHLLTHGAFKANMFLGAGAVMHGMHEDTNMRHFGALSKAMPWVFYTFAAGYLAIIGFPFLSGYYSKDHIIVAAFGKSPIFGVLALLGAGVTAFYMTRLMMMTFLGAKRWPKGVEPHKPGPVMVVPLVLLGLLSVFAGAVMNNWIQGWLEPAIGNELHEDGLLHFTGLTAVTLLVSVAGVLVGWWMYKSEIAAETPAKVNVLATIGREELYANQLNEAVFMRPGQSLVNGLEMLDRTGVDGAVRGLGTATTAASKGLRALQNGNVRSYGLTMLVGVILIGATLIFGRLA